MKTTRGRSVISSTTTALLFPALFLLIFAALYADDLIGSARSRRALLFIAFNSLFILTILITTSHASSSAYNVDASCYNYCQSPVRYYATANPPRVVAAAPEEYVVKHDDDDQDDVCDGGEEESRCQSSDDGYDGEEEEDDDDDDLVDVEEMDEDSEEEDDDDDDDDDDVDDDLVDVEEMDEDSEEGMIDAAELEKRAEEFIANVNKKWKEELLADRGGLVFA